MILVVLPGAWGGAGGKLTYHDRTSPGAQTCVPSLYISLTNTPCECVTERCGYLRVFEEFTKNSQQGHHNERGYVRHLSGLRQFRLLPPFSNIRPRYARWTVHYNPVVMATGTLSTSPQLDSYIFTKLIIIISLIVSKGQLTWLPMNQWTMNIVITCFHGVISYWRSSVWSTEVSRVPSPSVYGAR